MAPLEAGFQFSVDTPQASDDGKLLRFPIGCAFSHGMGRMVGDIVFSLKALPQGVEVSAGLSGAAMDDGSRDWRFGMSDLNDLELVVPAGSEAFDLNLSVEARGQSGGRLNFSRSARIVPPGARARVEPVSKAPPEPKPREGVQASVQTAPEPRAEQPASPPVTDWLTGNGVFIFASGHGGDLFEGGYGWSDQAAPAQNASEGDMELRLLSGGPVIGGPDPVVW